MKVEQDKSGISNEFPTHISKTWSNPRKRPHRHDPGSLFEPASNDDALRNTDDRSRLHAPKRSRANEWPLKDIDETIVTTVPKLADYQEKRSSSSSVRPSKFQEGSMNDKISQKPPSLYTREEQMMEEYARSQATEDGGLGMTFDAGIETDKPSGVFRFGRAIASAFKPFTAWPGIWKDKEKERSASPEKSVLQERQARAAEAYAELKKSGFKGTQVNVYRDVQASTKMKPKDSDNEAPPLFRDSGIDMGDSGTFYEPNPNDQLIDFTEALLVPPQPPKHRSISPFLNASSPRKSSLQIRKPSFQALKKVTSQIHLSPTKKEPEISVIPSLEIEQGQDSTTQNEPVLQRQPSKKDIAKHYRLSKKVSDLENKLETARRELGLSMSTAPPVPELPSHLHRKPFKPGALPSLPSERNMSPQKDDTMRSTSDDENIPPEDKRSSAHVAHGADIFRSGTNLQDVKDLAVAEGKSKARKPSKQLQAKPQTSNGVQKRLPKVPSKTPRNSPLRADENMPPVPAVDAIVDPTKTPRPDTNSKVTDHTSVSHLARAPSPFLGPPASASPRRTRSKTSRRGVSPPPPSVASAKKPTAASDVADTPIEGVESTLESDVNVDPVKSEVLQQKPKKSFLSAEISEDKALPGTHKESFEWDDDVF